ncbi:uncharacterized protein [Spinacia oleracea]|uniref:Retrotransposon gag domain-containing protein n=1 Tax=Spinacia oleracea TaxID=3562 RepID=A0A9R0JF23_SPIOL|nr:uncharacterized protein LOC110805366 [Spinacia oleracea]
MTRKSKQSPFIPVDLELDRTLRIVRRQLRGVSHPQIIYTDSESEEDIMADDGPPRPPPPKPRLLRDYGHPESFELRSGILLPTTTVNNFELSPSLIRMIKLDQFGGAPTECPFTHLDNFYELCATIKQNGVTDEFVKMHMFHFSLRDKAKHWLRTVPEGSLTTWNEVTKAFLDKYCPPEKAAELRRKITNFTQEEDETLSEAWERFKEYVRSCPHHGFNQWLVVQSFYDGLHPTSRSHLDAGAGGQIKKLPVEKMIEEIAKLHAWGSDRRATPKKSVGGKHEVDTIDFLNSKFDMLAKRLEKSNMGSTCAPVQVMSCEICGGVDHLSSYCNSTMEQAAAINPRFDPYSQTYNSGWRHHPNFSYKYNQGIQPPPPPQQQQAPQRPTPIPPYRPPGFNQGAYNQGGYNQGASSQPKPQFNQAPPQKSNLESIMETFIAHQTKTNVDIDKRLSEVTSSVQQLQAHNKII